MFNDVYRGSHSNDSTSTDPFYSAKSSMEDEEMLDMIGNPFFNYDGQPWQTVESVHDVPQLDTVNILQSSTDPSSATSAFTPNLSGSSSVAAQDNDPSTYEKLMRNVWISPPDMPINVIKYSIGRRELAMQTQIDQPFDLVEPDPYVHPPVHTPATESLKEWHKIAARTPVSLNSNKESTTPRVKLAFGPLGWDQVWAYEYIDLERIWRNADYKDWWARRSCDHLIWCGMHNSIEIYGVEVKFPYGHDTTVTTSTSVKRQSFTEEVPIRIPANETVLIPLGKHVADWAKQVFFLYDYSEHGPALPFPFHPNEYPHHSFTITLRFKNAHPNAPIFSSTPLEDKGCWTKGWLSTDEATILSGEINTEYLNTVIDGGPRPDPSLTNHANRIKMLQFWGVDRKRTDMVEHLVGQEWMWERFDVDRRHRGDMERLRGMVRDKFHESVVRAMRDVPC